MAGEYNYTIEQGATFSLSMQWKDDTGQVISLQGYTAKMQIRTKDFSKTLLKELSTANGKINIDVNNVININLSATDTTAMAAGIYNYDLELTSQALVVRLIEGEVTVSAEVTK